MTLNKLELNQKGIIINIDSDLKIKQRLLDLGLINGTIIEKVFIAPLGDPSAYEFRGNIIALRNSDTKKIKIVLK